MHRQFLGVSLFSNTKPSSLHYIKRARAHSQHTSSFVVKHLTTISCTLLVLVVFLWARQELLGELVSLEQERNLGMDNIMKNFSKVMLSYHLYSSAYELEYSCCVIIMTYELAYSLCVMILTCSTLCLIIHMVCMSRSRVKLRWWFIVPSVLPISFTYRSIGSGTRGIWVVSLYMGVVLGCIGSFRYDGAPWLRCRWQVVIALSVPCIPPCSGIV